MLDSIGRYKIQEQIGSGSMGQVYRALDTTLDRDVALKAIETGPTLDPSLKERFYREARLCARLQHSNIVTVYDMGEADNYAYIAMELLHGRNLKNLIEDRETFPLAEKVEAMAQAAAGLAHAHRSGLVHRDLKPSNLFRTDSGQIKILDFGIARMPASMLTVAGLVLGTPNYMAPEQILGQALDGRADLFSLAIALFSWISFEHPFQSDSIPKRIASQAPDHLIDVAPFAGAELDSVLEKALSRSPADRYQTGDELAQALRHAVAEGSTGSQPVMQVAFSAAPETPPESDLSFGSMQSLQPPADQDPAEWRISRFLKALQEFDEAYDVRSLPVAQESLRTIEQLASEDERFQVAAAEYRARLEDLEASQRPLVPIPPISPAPTVEISTPVTPVSAPVQSDLSDATRLLATPILSSLQQPVSVIPDQPLLLATAPVVAEAAGPAPHVAASLYATPKPAAAKLPLRTRPKPSTGSLALKVVGALAICGALFLVLNPLFRGKGYAASASFGTAEVNADSTRLMSGSTGDGRLIKELSKGDRVNVLTYQPDLRSQWISVQYVDGKNALEPGYVPLASLANWSRLNLVKAFEPGPKAGPEQRSRYVATLAEFLKSAAPEDVEPARQEIARQNLILENPSGALPPAVATGENLPESSESSGANPAAAAEQSPYSVEQDFARANNAFENGEYERAKRALRRILKHEPANVEAHKFLERVLAAQKLDPGVGK